MLVVGSEVYRRSETYLDCWLVVVDVAVVEFVVRAIFVVCGKATKLARPTRAAGVHKRGSRKAKMMNTARHGKAEGD